jgi:hypothetical protein
MSHHDDEYAPRRAENRLEDAPCPVRLTFFGFAPSKLARRPVRANRAGLCHQRLCRHQSDACDCHTPEGTEVRTLLVITLPSDVLPAASFAVARGDWRSDRSISSVTSSPKILERK